jgi:hypothetical protein
VAIGPVAFGLLCVQVLPDYVGAEAGWRTLWAFVGALFALVGLAGGMIELGRAWSGEGLDDVATVVVLGGLAAFLHLGQANFVTGVAASVMRFAVVALLVGLAGLGIAVARVASTPRQTKRRSGQDRAVGALSLATAVVGLLAAILNATQ